ncbi:MAG: hypothetical protein LBK73_00950 [Treponema sp.]|nr:hypothetical protein [Treponema sp.]
METIKQAFPEKLNYVAYIDIDGIRFVNTNFIPDGELWYCALKKDEALKASDSRKAAASA